MVCCSLSGILWQLELIEGNDAPSTIIPKFNNQGKMVGLLLQMLEPIFGRGNVVVLNSGFCVLRGIVELKRHGVYAFPLMKKQKYCDRIPSTTPGAEPPRDAKDSGSARPHSTHLETSSTNRP